MVPKQLLQLTCQSHILVRNTNIPLTCPDSSFYIKEINKNCNLVTRVPVYCNTRKIKSLRSADRIVFINI